MSETPEARGLAHIEDMGKGLIRAIEANVPSILDAETAKALVEAALVHVRESMARQ